MASYYKEYNLNRKLESVENRRGPKNTKSPNNRRVFRDSRELLDNSAFPGLPTENFESENNNNGTEIISQLGGEVNKSENVNTLLCELEGLFCYNRRLVTISLCNNISDGRCGV